MEESIEASWTTREGRSDCGTGTVHAVSVGVRAESDEEENTAFSWEPCRPTLSRVCGDETALRTNNPRA